MSSVLGFGSDRWVQRPEAPPLSSCVTLRTNCCDVTDLSEAAQVCSGFKELNLREFVHLLTRETRARCEVTEGEGRGRKGSARGSGSHRDAGRVRVRIIMALSGKVALVTGGAQGIGRAAVQSLLQSSAKVGSGPNCSGFRTWALQNLADLQLSLCLSLVLGSVLG